MCVGRLKQFQVLGISVSGSATHLLLPIRFYNMKQLLPKQIKLISLPICKVFRFVVISTCNSTNPAYIHDNLTDVFTVNYVVLSNSQRKQDLHNLCSLIPHQNTKQINKITKIAIIRFHLIYEHCRCQWKLSNFINKKKQSERKPTNMH